MKKVTAGIKKRIWAHKITSAIILIVIVLVGYWGYKKFTSAGGEPRYVIAKVERGDIIASISGSGQVSSLNQVEVKAKASGDVAYLAVKDGQKIGKGRLTRLQQEKAEASEVSQGKECGILFTPLEPKDTRIQSGFTLEFYEEKPLPVELK